MRKGSRLLLAATLVIGTMSSMGISFAHEGCSDNTTTGVKHKHTASGSCKDPKNGFQIKCGSNGKVTTVSGFSINANQTSDGAEAEACSDGGPGNQQGRLMVVISTNPANPGARIILDSDPDQAFPASYIMAQVSPEHPGVWCTKDSKPADGYAQPWNNPGNEGGLGPQALNCTPQFGF